MKIEAMFVSMSDEGHFVAHVSEAEYDRLKVLDDIAHEVLDDVTQTTRTGIDKKERKVTTKGYLFPKVGNLVICGIDEKSIVVLPA